MAALRPFEGKLATELTCRKGGTTATESVKEQVDITNKGEGEQKEQFVVSKELMYGGHGKKTFINGICTNDATMEEMNGLNPPKLDGREAAVRGDDKKQLRRENKRRRKEKKGTQEIESQLVTYRGKRQVRKETEHTGQHWNFMCPAGPVLDIGPFMDAQLEQERRGLKR